MYNIDKNEIEKLESLLQDVEIPEVYRIKQEISCKKIDNISKEVNQKFHHSAFMVNLKSRMKGKKTIGIAVGSRGITNLDEIVKAIIRGLKLFPNISILVIPAMGSHGGATASGQKEILSEYGITEEALGVPIVKSMETVLLDFIDGEPIYWDKLAASLDGVVLINRIKPHTSFRHKVESGLFKIATIGLGNQKGAAAIHKKGFYGLGERIEKAGKYIFEKGNILFGVAILENAFDETESIHLIFPEEISAIEPKLLDAAKKNIPKIPFAESDVLIIDTIGKNYSGPGADPNVTGRFASGIESDGFKTQALAFLDLSPESHGNANGLGVADVITEQLCNKINFIAGYTNTLTSTLSLNAKIPMVMPSADLAIKAAIKFSHQTNIEDLKLIRIKNTLELETMEITEALTKELTPSIKITSGPQKMSF